MGYKNRDAIAPLFLFDLLAKNAVFLPVFDDDDMAVLKPHFESYGFTLTETTDGGTMIRKLSKGNTDILTIRKTGNTIELNNSLRHYSYTVTGGQV